MRTYLILAAVCLTAVLALVNALSKPSDTSLPNTAEEYNTALGHIRSVPQLLAYCDSLYGKSQIAGQDSLRYANIVAHTLRQRFFHGLSNYGFSDNWLLYLLQWVHPHSLAVVYENDILQYPQALCSQQAIVGMMALKQKGFTFRKVGFKSKSGKYGHFTYEIKLRDGWHFYDLDKEPNEALLNAAQRPSIAELAQNDTVRRTAYAKNGPRVSDDLIPYYTTAFTPNTFPARNMLLFQRLCRFGSYTLWVFLALFYYWRYDS